MRESILNESAVNTIKSRLSDSEDRSSCGPKRLGAEERFAGVRLGFRFSGLNCVQYRLSLGDTLSISLNVV
jgi:hypothetical protein